MVYAKIMREITTARKMLEWKITRSTRKCGMKCVDAIFVRRIMTHGQILCGGKTVSHCLTHDKGEVQLELRRCVTI